MNTILIPLLQVVSVALDLYKWVVIIWVVLSWLVAFGVVNNRNQIVNTVGRALEALVEPALKRIRRFVPMMGNVDISPVILIIGLLFLKQLIFWLYIQIFI